VPRILIWSGVGLILLGLILAGIGALTGLLASKGGRLLPGDIVVSRPGFTFLFPVATCVLLSVLLTLVLWAIAAWRR
jgi:hypothetical protein